MTEEEGYAPHDVEWTPEKIGRVWSYFASNPSYGHQYFSAHSGPAIAARVDSELHLADKRVLDFGCGRGDLLAQFVLRGVAASGLEFDPASAAETRARFAGEPLFRGVEVARSLPTQVADASFDVVLLVEVVEHLLEDQISATLDEVRRLLPPGGHVVVTTVNEEDLGANSIRCPDCGATFHRWQHLRAFSAASLAALLEQHGFATVKSEALLWGASPGGRLRTRLRALRRSVSYPHLLYLGVRR